MHLVRARAPFSTRAHIHTHTYTYTYTYTYTHTHTHIYVHTHAARAMEDHALLSGEDDGDVDVNDHVVGMEEEDSDDDNRDDADDDDDDDERIQRVAYEQARFRYNALEAFDVDRMSDNASQVTACVSVDGTVCVLCVVYECM